MSFIFRFCIRCAIEWEVCCIGFAFWCLLFEALTLSGISLLGGITTKSFVLC